MWDPPVWSGPSSRLLFASRRLAIAVGQLSCAPLVRLSCGSPVIAAALTRGRTPEPARGKPFCTSNGMLDVMKYGLEEWLLATSGRVVQNTFMNGAQHLIVERLDVSHGHLDGAEEIPVLPQVGPQARDDANGVRGADVVVVDRLDEVRREIEYKIAERRQVVRGEVVAEGEVGDKAGAGSHLVDTLVAEGNEEAGAAAQHETLPPVGPELVGRSDRGHPVEIGGVAGRHAEGDVERLGQVLRLGEDDAGHEGEVSEIGLVVLARRSPIG